MYMASVNIKHIRKFIDSVYAFGRASWDTGICDKCGAILTEDERYEACNNMFHHGFLYCCEACTKEFLIKIPFS